MAKTAHRKRTTHRKAHAHARPQHRTHARKTSARPSSSSSRPEPEGISIPSMPESDAVTDEESRGADENRQAEAQSRVTEDDSEDEAGTYGPGTGEMG